MFGSCLLVSSGGCTCCKSQKVDKAPYDTVNEIKNERVKILYVLTQAQVDISRPIWLASFFLAIKADGYKIDTEPESCIRYANRYPSCNRSSSQALQRAHQTFGWHLFLTLLTHIQYRLNCSSIQIESNSLNSSSNVPFHQSTSIRHIEIHHHQKSDNPSIHPPMPVLKPDHLTPQPHKKPSLKQPSHASWVDSFCSL